MFPWYLLLAVGMMITQLGIQYASVSADIDQDLASLARTVQPTVTTAVWELDSPHLLAIARGIRQNAIVSGLEVDSVNGAVLLRDGSLPAGPDSASRLPGLFRKVTVPLLYQSPRGDSRLVGQLGLYTSRHIVWTRTRYSSFMVLLNSIIVSVGLWLILSWTIRYRLSGTVTRVAQAVAGWRFQADDVPVEHTHYPYQDELGLLVQALNDMLTSTEARKRELVRANQLLAASEAELKAINTGLEQRVKDRTAELQALFDSAGVGIALMQDGVMLRCNRRMDELFGYDYGEQVGRSTRIWYADEAAWAEGNRASDRHAALGETHVSAQSVLRKDGRPFWVRMSDRAVDVTDTSKGMVLVVEDITAEYAALEEMTRARMLAEQNTRMKSEFLATMSHEIRTPMNAILGMLYLALKTALAPVQRNYLLKAQGAAHSLLGIINDILDFSKIEAGKLDIEQVEFSLEATLQQLSDSIAWQAESKGVEFLIRYDSAIPPMLVGDPLRLGQVLLNLCGNAIKFTERGEVELSFHATAVHARDITVEVCVRDTGIGIAPEVQARLFEKFTQADQSMTRRFGGTGLGLAICKNLVELMGGRIWLKNSVSGQGTTLCFSLPFNIAAQGQQRHELLEQAGPLLKGVRVLVVDDNAVSRAILGEMLRFLQLEVTLAADAEEALAVLDAATMPFDLVLMGWRLPGMNGDVATRRIRDNATLRQQPKIIMMTAHGREDVMHLAGQAGADGFLIKPVSPSTLLDTLLSALGRGRVLGDGSQLIAASAEGAASFAGRRLLLVEDNEINREFAGQLLSREGFAVDEAVNGEEAVAKVGQQDYDVVLMDIQMPVMDGLEAARQIRALGQRPGGERLLALPIIAMSALAMSKDIQRSIAAGMNDHVTKPVAPDILLAVLAKWVALPEPVAGDGGHDPMALPADLAALTSLDAAAGLHRIGGKAEAYRKQLRRFREHYAGAADALRQLLAAGAEEAREYCHELRGVVGNIGATALYEVLDLIEQRLRHGEAPATLALEELQACLRDLLRDIDSLPPEPVAALAGEHPLQALPLHELLGRLADALENDLGVAEDLLAGLLAGVRGTAWELDVAALAARIDVFDLDEAQALLKKLQQQLAAG
jgi:PAS domain S-box-containing protein